ncbi:hypothetical protein [Riemerella anatipestifer]|uniref:hypothetical protein n=1 Tax=Riemerella anatipestifer TaxID=34085 RepID=UPI001372682D|nr:hypothetical protein [Riemerella anatipestifer]MBT0549158.1 hypothetical protein [Riemerella anatipestifer]MBT0556155.1 hypothetical protein [Riemerella anatipestifer]MBT0559921.1 hypothetical protein [Riemerella anatipestifer]MCO4303192.1 hypothetical protein [Riemerella anatipestifer]MCO7353604.1 hypothetical protein [Riemerella anatipestifer]
MIITEKQHYIEIEGSDHNGDYNIQIQTDGSQIRVKTEDENVFIETNLEKLMVIRDCLNNVINRGKK